MILILAAILGGAWLLGFTVFHVASGALHVLLVLAILGVIFHVVRGARVNRRPAGRFG